MRWPWQARTAAVEPLTPGWNRGRGKARPKWWERAEFFSTNLGAIRFACGLKADAGARCTLQVEKMIDPRKDEWEPCSESQPIDMLHAYRGKASNQAELVRLHMWLYETLGEAYQILEPDTFGNRKRVVWSIRSPLAVHYKNDGVLVQDLPNGTVRDGTAKLLPFEQVRRMWISHETWPGQAISPLQGVLSDCERYWTLQRRMQRTVDEALGMAALLWTPDEAHTQFQQQQKDPSGKGPGTNLEEDYYQLALRTHSEDDAASSIAPPMFRWAKDLGPPVKVDLTQPFEAQAIPWRTEALESIGRGLNYPQRLLVTGVGDGNHWSDWLLEEQFAKSSLAPGLERVCWGDLTETFLQPALSALRSRGDWQGDPGLYRVGFDMAPVVVHPNQSSQALELYKIGVLSDTKLLEVSGFDSTAAPDEIELQRWILTTQIQRERISPKTPGVDPPGEANVLQQLPAAPGGVIAAASRVRESITVGPMASERAGWLD